MSNTHKRTAKTAKAKQAKKVRLETDFAGIKAGAMLFVATPEILQQYIAGIPRGEFRTIHRIRNELARQHQCDATCPVSTAIFIRQVAERALEAITSGQTADQVTPFWRVVEPDSKIAKRLNVDSAWLAHMQVTEGIKPST